VRAIVEISTHSSALQKPFGALRGLHEPTLFRTTANIRKCESERASFRAGCLRKGKTEEKDNASLIAVGRSCRGRGRRRWLLHAARRELGDIIRMAKARAGKPAGPFSWRHRRSKNGVASLARSRSKNGVASLARSRSKNDVASLAYASQ
jgi:hypothetical protein